MPKKAVIPVRGNPAVKYPQVSSENSAQNAWNWNYNNQAWNNNNKNNNNGVCGVRDYARM